MKKIKTTDIALVIIAVLTIVFVIVNLILFDLHETIPSTLVTCWFSAVVGEFGILGWIKTTKVKQMDQERQKELYERLKADRENTGGVR